MILSSPVARFLQAVVVMAALALCARAQGLRVASEDQAKDLPPKKVTNRDEENVRGGAEPLSRPKPFDPSNG